MEPRLRRTGIAVSAALGVFLGGASAQADDFYKGKTVKLIVGSGEGAGASCGRPVALKALAKWPSATGTAS